MTIRENYRERLVTDLYKIICGPYYGKFEVLPQCRNPQRIYLSGVLAPLNTNAEEDHEEELINEGERGEDDSTIEDEVDNPLTFVTALDSKSRPQSLGISFLVKTKEEVPSFNVCITWARYLWSKEWNKIKNQYNEGGIEFSGPDPDICKTREDDLSVNDSIDNEDSDGITIDVESFVDDKIINPFLNTQRQMMQEESLKDFQSLGAWFRDPRYVILEDIKLAPKDDFYHFNYEKLEDSQFFTVAKSNIINEKFKISFRISEVVSFKSERIYRISVYFINQEKKYEREDGEQQDDKDKKLNGQYVERYIFQPQIRIKLNDDTKKVPYEFDFDKEIDENIKWGSEEYEEFNLKMLYRNKKPYARGHMCSAVWKEIDPERDCLRDEKDLKILFGNQIPGLWQPLEEDNNFIRKVSEKFPPFYWLDGEILKDDSLFDKFSISDIRTEYIPVFPINAPNFTWRDFDSTGVNRQFLNPKILAEDCWNAEKLDEYFKPMLEGYVSWIEIQKNKIKKRDDFEVIAKINIGIHEKILDRMRKGLDILKDDVNARLAFCFANKAIIHQYEMNGSRSDFRWRPFQIAFLLLSIQGIIQRTSNIQFPFHSNSDRDIVDLIWIPTGGGKTEAYLLIAAFTIAYRRRIGIKSDTEFGTHYQLGVNIISRYTLRLLTIQQFRRGLKIITACELLRLNGIDDNFQESKIIGWLPNRLICLKNKESSEKVKFLSDFPEFRDFFIEDWIWGSTRFSIGLWIGGKMTPNRLRPIPLKGNYIPGAIDALRICNISPKGKEYDNVREGDPAQVIQCPACNSYLSLPKKRGNLLPSKEIEIFLLIRFNTQDIDNIRRIIENLLQNRKLLKFLDNSCIQISNLHQFKCNIFILGLKFDFRGKNIDNRKLRDWWKNIQNATHYELLAADILNPGYFILSDSDYSCTDQTHQPRPCEYDFEIRCLNPECALYNSFFTEKNIIKKEGHWTEVNPLFQIEDKTYLSKGIPIHAYTVDEQIYRKLPTILIGTIDKFAQIAFNDAVGTIFGNVEKYHLRHGFTRKRVPLFSGHHQIRKDDASWINDIEDIPPPEIILQDELHLIEGPLGSYVGVYEMAIDYLCLRKREETYLRPKYIASTATIAACSNQIQSLYTRKFNIFPPAGLLENDCFFQYYEDLHPLEETQIGRLYIGLAAPGKSSQTTLARVFGSFLNVSFQIKEYIGNNITPIPTKYEMLNEIDRFWTLVGYFNTIKELARTRSVCNQDLREWLRQFYGYNSRVLPLNRNDPVELSSQTDSVILPMHLKNLNIGLIDRQANKMNEPDSITNIVLTTSMFGTGVDVPRLGLMVIDGQPKTTGQYIQTSGRIGRNGGGIILTFLHAGRPRDLDHYEQFIGYHLAIYRYIEPSTISPFAPNCLETTIGPVSVALLRQAKEILGKTVDYEWRDNNIGPKRIIKGHHDPRNIELMKNYLQLVEDRHELQPASHKLLEEIKKNIFTQYNDDIEKWYTLIQKKKELKYYQFLNEELEKKMVSVVLGDPQHQFAEMEGEIDVIFKNAPNSLRGVEPTICLGVPWRKN